MPVIGGGDRKGRAILEEDGEGRSPTLTCILCGQIHHSLLFLS